MRHLYLLALVPLLFPDRALAFCGTFVSAYDDNPKNAASEVAIVRQGTHTTLTVANDYVGDTRDFAMVVPVPEILTADQVHVVDPAVFDRLRDYSNPRSVRYTCADFEYESDADTDTDSDADADSDTGADTVEVEAEYVVGEYDVKILSAEESTGLVDWLQTNGYRVPDASADLLGEYLAGGAYFFAAQVRADAGIQSGDTLSPLQFSYDSDVLGLPIRIGTLNSPGQQDLRIYAISDYDAGAIGISNYDEATIDHDCMWQGDDGESLTEYYDAELARALGDGTSANWVTEYSWGNGDCDPCTGVIPSEDDVYSLGYQPDYHYGMYYWFTRLRMRYTPESATQDLVLYESRRHDTQQMRFIDYDARLEEHFPVCNVGWVTDGGTCDEDTGTNQGGGGCNDDGGSGDSGGSGDTSHGGTASDGGCGCGGSSGRAGMAAMLLFAAYTRRRGRRAEGVARNGAR